MEIGFDDLSWYWFKGNMVPGRILQDVCMFRSCVLFDSGLRENFGNQGRNFGDIQFSDFESYHIIACHREEILGTVRITPPGTKTVTQSILGMNDYCALIRHLDTSLDCVIEINRLMIDKRVRGVNLGRTLMLAAIGLIENAWNRAQMTIIGSAGNCTRQADFLLKCTDCEKISEVQERYVSTFNDQVTFLKFGHAPYKNGAEKIEFFKNLFKIQTPLPWPHLTMNYGVVD